MARPIVKPTGPPKQKQRRPANSTKKRAKINCAIFEFYCVFGQIWITLMLNILSRNAHNCIWLHVTSSQSSSKLPSKSQLPRSFKLQSWGIGFPPRTSPGLGSFSSTTFYQYLSFNNHQLIFVRFSSSFSRHRIERFFTSNMTFSDSSAFLRG